MNVRLMKISSLFAIPLFCLIAGGLLLPMPRATVHAATKKTVTKKPVKKIVRMTVSAIPGKDEKTIVNPKTRCLTVTIKTLHEKTVKQMTADIAKLGLGHDDAIKYYQSDIETIWSAMFEPYCGYGSRGVAAVANGFKKSASQARGRFLTATKKPPTITTINAAAKQEMTSSTDGAVVPNPLGIQF